MPTHIPEKHMEQKQKVIETLKKDGFIDQLKAQLRAQVVKQLEAEKKQQLGAAAKYIKPLSLTTTRKVVENEDGLLCAELIREFLQFYKMEHTLSVFVPEMSLHADFPKTRDQMTLECGLARSQDNDSKPLLLNLVEKVRVGDFAPASAQKNQSPGTDDLSSSPNQMKPNFGHSQENNGFADQTPPTTGVHGSGEAQDSRKNTRNKKQKQSKQSDSKNRKGTPYEQSNSSDNQNKKQDMASLGDLPAFGKQNQAAQYNQQNDMDYNFDGFDDIENSNNSDQQSPGESNKFSNAQRHLNDFDDEQRDGFKVEVKRPQGNKSKAVPGSSGKKNRKVFGSKFGQNNNEFDNENKNNQDGDDDIEEDIQTERERESASGHYDNKVESSLGYQAGITVSQSLGIDPSVDSLALDEYDHIEVVEL